MEKPNQHALACDVLVVGSGASGLVAAVTAAHFGLRVIVAEKAPVFGGTTAWSGGWLWIPHNPLAVQAGITEPPELPRRYLAAELGNRANDPRLDAFLQNGPEMVGFFQDHTEMRWIDGNRVPDFHDSDGAGKGGRSVSVAPYDGGKLGEWLDRLRPPLDIVSLWGMGIAAGPDIGNFFNATRKPRAAIYTVRRIMRHLRDLALHGRGRHLVSGNALVARLMRSALDKGVTLMPEAPVQGLLVTDGRVTGATVFCADGPVQIHAARGVVLASGGFPHDPARLQALAPLAGGGGGHRSAAPRDNSGDGLRMAEAAGAEIADDLASNVALAPVSLVPKPDGSKANFPHLIDRAKPGIIAVTLQGQRFVNEANSYYDFMQALIAVTPLGQQPGCWLIADHTAQRRWGLGWAKPFPFPLRGALRSGYLKRGHTLQDLAGECGIPAEALAQTVAQFNAGAEQGRDPDFRRGESLYNRVQGDALHAPNPSLAPLARGPFYAVRIVPGSLGTFAGARTDAAARVLDTQGQPIPGLLAVGNDMASVMGGHYPAGGITLGPGMTFGYIAGRVLAGQPVTGLSQEKLS